MGRPEGRGMVWSCAEALHASDPVLRVMAQALDSVTAVVPSFLAGFGEVALAPRGVVAGRGVAKVAPGAALDIEALWRTYVRRYSAVDPFVETLRRRPDVKLLTTQDVTAAARRAGCRFREGYLRRFGGDSRVVLFLRDGPAVVGTLSLTRQLGSSDFSALEVAFLRRTQGLIESSYAMALRQARAPRRAIAMLTPRQAEVAELVAMGASNDEIARVLVLTVGSVKSQLHRIFRRVGVESRTQLAAMMHGG